VWWKLYCGWYRKAISVQTRRLIWIVGLKIQVVRSHWGLAFKHLPSWDYTCLQKSSLVDSAHNSWLEEDDPKLPPLVRLFANIIEQAINLWQFNMSYSARKDLCEESSSTSEFLIWMQLDPLHGLQNWALYITLCGPSLARPSSSLALLQGLLGLPN
jgi:hypothetical protein